ncbi:MAG: hypothetical protein H6936_09965 [Burkholderiales bacterium]|nr:hypothetical protein [Nitrosomonas sp.]MCP5275157.1 hypothetical protein [Burkholderiales bacterium]
MIIKSCVMTARYKRQSSEPKHWRAIPRYAVGRITQTAWWQWRIHEVMVEQFIASFDDVP